MAWVGEGAAASVPGSGDVGAFSKDHKGESVSGVLLGLIWQTRKGLGDCF